MSATTVGVAGVGVFVPGFADIAAWLTGQASEGAIRPTGELYPKRLRRRASTFSRALADVYAETTRSLDDDESVSLVIGSSIGEANTMIDLLDQMWREETALSPTRFAMSVHNAAAGMVTIATANTGFATSLGADFDTPAMALIEACGLVIERGQAAVVVCGDEPVPEKLVPPNHGWDMLAAGLLLVPVERAVHGTLSMPARAPASVPAPGLAAGLARNPQAGMLDLVDAIVRGRSGTVALDRGRGCGWTVAFERAAD